MRRGLALALGSAMLASCNAPQNGPPSPSSSSPSSLSSIFHIQPEFYGKTKTSYGSLSKEMDNNTHQPLTPALCDGTDRAVNELSRQIVGTMFSPTEYVFKPDEPIRTEELQHNFKISTDPGTNVPVTILDRDRAGITFWFQGNLVNISEVTSAAHEYCAKFKKVEIYEGSAKKCSEPKWTPLNVGGKDIRIIETYVISSFRCSDG